MDGQRNLRSIGILSRWQKGNLNCQSFLRRNNSLQRRDNDLLTLFEIVEFELKVERDSILDWIDLNRFIYTKVEDSLSSTDPKSIILGKMLLRSGKVGYA
jgi:hypothetical protein